MSPKNLMGPVGIVHAGTKFAFKGGDWLLWFLSMISANLAVVNFLPIPIVDGGQFLFLIIEKIQGRPLSAKTQSIAQVVGLAVLECVPARDLSGYYADVLIAPGLRSCRYGRGPRPLGRPIRHPCFQGSPLC